MDQKHGPSEKTGGLQNLVLEEDVKDQMDG
jgi:hypothetical protein